MARPRKRKNDLAIRKEVYATAVEWSEISTAAMSAGLTISKYLLAAHRTGVIAAPAQGPQLPLMAARLQAEVEVLAATVARMPSAPVLLTRLVKIEEALTVLVREIA